MSFYREPAGISAHVSELYDYPFLFKDSGRPTMTNPFDEIMKMNQR